MDPNPHQIITDKARVYLNETVTPPHPGEGWTRFVCISDTHSNIDYGIPKGDVFIHAGDLTRRGYIHQLLNSIEWICSLPHADKIVIAGNHDLCLDERLERTKLLKEEGKKARNIIRTKPGMMYLENQEARVQDWKIFGHPGSPRYGTGAFQYRVQPGIWECIPDDTEILITHTPAEGTLDETTDGISAGCPELRARIPELKRLRMHVFGHIHDAHGVVIDSNGVIRVNAAVLWMGNCIVVDMAK